MVTLSYRSTKLYAFLHPTLQLSRISLTSRPLNVAYAREHNRVKRHQQGSAQQMQQQQQRGATPLPPDAVPTSRMGESPSPGYYMVPIYPHAPYGPTQV